MIYEDGLNIVRSEQVDGQHMPSASIIYRDQLTADKFNLDISNSLRLHLIMGRLMEVIDEFSQGHAHLDCLELSANGKVEGLITTEPYYYYKITGYKHRTSCMMNELMKDNGFFRLCDWNPCQVNSSRICMYMDFRKERTRTELSCIMLDGWKF